MSLKDDSSCGTFIFFGGGHKWQTPRMVAEVQPPPKSGAPHPDLSSGLAGIAKLVPHATNLTTLHRQETEAGVGFHVQITLWGRLSPARLEGEKGWAAQSVGARQAKTSTERTRVSSSFRWLGWGPG